MTLRVATRYDVLNCAVVKVEVVISLLGVVKSKRQKVEQEVIHGVSRGDSIQGYNAGIGFFDAIGLLPALDVGLCLNGEPHGIN